MRHSHTRALERAIDKYQHCQRLPLAMRLRIARTELRVTGLRTRVPFEGRSRPIREVQQVFVRVWLEVDGAEWEGTASELLPPKWITNDDSRPIQARIDELLKMIGSALHLSAGVSGESIFELWQHIYSGQSAAAKGRSGSWLLVQFGTSLVERALIEAFCRAQRRPFWQLVRENVLGLRLAKLHAELGERTPAEFLPETPLDSLVVRHRVGISDPLTDDEIDPTNRAEDGLPQSLA